MEVVNNRNLINKLIFIIEKYYFVFFVFLLLISLINLFYKLGDQSIINFDEARHGVSAYEMLKSGNYVVNTYNFHNDYWNLKPPLSFWAVAAGFKLGGFSPFGLRIPSAVCALITIAIIGLFVKNRNGNLASIISMSFLLTSSQYILYHGARTGDPDSLFVLLFTISMISMLLMDRNINYLYLAGFAFSLAFLTKSWHAGCIPVILGLYLIFTGKIKKLTLKNWFIVLFFAIFPIFIWGIIRFQYDGFTFFKNMINYDLLMRSSSTLEGHRGGPFYYLIVLLNLHNYGLWLCMLILLVFLIILKQKFEYIKNNRHFFVGILFWILIPLILFSFPKTKIAWYILPVFPPLSILAGVLAGRVLTTYHSMIKLLVVLGIIICFSGNEYEIFHIISHTSNENVQSILLDLKSKHVKVSNKKIYNGNTNQNSQGLGYRLNDWQQGEVLAAKLYDNLVPLDGGFKTFNKKPNSLLLITKNKYNNLSNKNNYNVVVNKDDLYIISH